MKNSFKRLPSVLVLEIFHFLNIFAFSSLISVEKYLFNIFESSSHKKMIDKIILTELTERFPYLKGMLLSEAKACESEFQVNSLNRNIQRFRAWMKLYYHHFPINSGQRRGEGEKFWVEFNTLMGFELTHLIVDHYLLIRKEYQIIFDRDYQGDNLISVLHKKSIDNNKEKNRKNITLEKIFQSYIPQILGSYYQKKFTISENIHHFLIIFQQLQNLESSFITFTKLFAFSLACDQGKIVEVCQRELPHYGYSNGCSSFMTTKNH